jgi:L,D-peptidoglycan transpeptidase YkuD (ErfK/YbiS/YcfS/YnhG family)
LQRPMSTAGEPLIVTALAGAAVGTISFGGRTHRCALGGSGILAIKCEGDGATPAGRWPLTRVLYRPDRHAPPLTGLPLSAIRPNDGWCDDPADAAYNRPVTLPHRSSAEALWRSDHLYDLVVVLGHNNDPVISGAGSAIFLHLCRPTYEPTAGCVAVILSDMIEILRHSSPGTEMLIALAR